MKKIIVSTMLAVAMIAGGSVYAQTDASTGATTQKENVQKGPKGDKKMKGKKGNKPKFNPFEGIQLTEDQQQKLQILHQGLGPVELSKKQQEKIKENPNLTPEQKKQLKEEKKAKKLEAKKKYLTGVKETLTPDQYVIFLENCYLYAPQGQGKHKGMKPGNKDGKHGEKGKKGNHRKTSANQ